MDGGDRARPRWLPWTWSLWHLPTRPLIYVLSIETAALAAVLLLAGPAPAASWATAGLLAACAVLHLHASHAIERIRRDRSRLPHVDLCSVWTIAGALVLPALAEVALILVIYAHRWLLVGRFDQQRPPYRAVFTVAMMTLAALAASTVTTSTGLRDHLLTAQLGWGDVAALVAAIAGHWLVNSAIVAGILLLTADLTRRRDALGSTADNLLEVAQLVLGGFVAFAAAAWPEVTLLMVVPLHLVHQSVLLHQYKLAARTDSRTGLLNAVAWQDTAHAALQRARHGRTPVSVMLLDLDFFKRINDTHGHQVGDDVLTRVATVLTDTVRRGDAIGRYGGEEFAVLQPGVGRADAAGIAERIRAGIADLDIRDDRDQPVRLTATIGVAAGHRRDHHRRHAARSRRRALRRKRRRAQPSPRGHDTRIDQPHLSSRTGHFTSLIARIISYRGGR
ncbi:GGDEF domain-containing protein [Amycolatopsis sp. H20-H5]|uniref:GGDEF domain-containing protein n=1 Tax=Amycolatopsis sp. H20-H5 TaxID=3046309 RepID=UPI002DBD27A3|nr:GGDEF domain-containing protein [Amycolatopsis sp. H20-H5]MEC3980846.1 GGDEF domain-containing protein [Amycolatopsis sp. H20-H5]